nr:MAG TPA: lysozyme family protein [Bacteriophage sp.]
MGITIYRKEHKSLRLSEHYTVADFWSNPAYDWIKLDDRLPGILEQFGEHFGKYPRLRNRYVGTDRYKMVPSAGFRNPKIDWKGSKTSQHCYGRGLDIEIPGIPAYRLAQFAETIPAIKGIGHYYNTQEPVDKCEHIHIDVRHRVTVSRWGHQNKTSGCNIPTFGGVYRIIRRGHQGCAVRLIQQALNDKIIAGLTVDGDFGSKTEKALRTYQKAAGLKPDGKYGRATNRKMKLFDWGD